MGGIRSNQSSTGQPLGDTLADDAPSAESILIVKAFGSLMYKIVEIGGNIVKGLWSGITMSLLTPTM